MVQEAYLTRLMHTASIYRPHIMLKHERRRFFMNTQKQYCPPGCNQMPGYNQELPPLPTGAPAGPTYAPYPVAPDILSQMGLQQPLQPGIGMRGGMHPSQQPSILPQPMLYPETIPGGCQCPPPADMQSGMRPRTMTPSGSIAPLPGTAFTGGEQSPLTTLNPMYTPGFLRTQIGQTVRVEFLIGTTSLTDRFGTLIGVGTSYILIQEAQTDDVLLCDIYSIKFVRFYH